MIETMLLWGLGLMAVAMLLVVVEIFIPSGGIFAVLAGLSSLSGVVCLFLHDPVWGMLGLLFVMVMAPTAFFVGLNIWKNTPIGRHMIGTESDEKLRAKIEEGNREIESRRKLIGVEGVAVTDLRPVGVVRIDGQRYDALADTHMIDAGQRVRVSSIESNQIKVRVVG